MLISASCGAGRSATRTFVLPPTPELAGEAERVKAKTLTPAPSAEPSPSPPQPEYLRIAYITIDDGPSRNITPEMLDILQSHSVAATFFVLPRANMGDLYERIISDGHALGNHTYSHEYRTLYSAESADAFRADVIKMHDYIKTRYGYEMTVFRFPGGTMGRPENIITPRKEILGELGYRWFDWDASFADTSPSPSAKDPDVLARNALRAADGRERLIILLHDSEDKTASANALDKVISALKERGYTFDTLENY
jgi:peptidoglycan/xylan/chitin deacetylase (PgdA/CDA1 family)